MDLPPHNNETSSSAIEVPTPKIGLPEYLRAETIESQLPGTVIYLHANTLRFDHATQQVWIDTGVKVDPSDLKPSIYARDKDRLAIMPVLTDNSTVYVIDATGLKPGGATVEQDLLGYSKQQKEADEGRERELDEYTVKKRAQHHSPVAIAFKNLEDEVELHGDPQYFEHLNYVIAQYTDILEENNSN